MNQRIQELATQAWHTTSDEVAHLNRIHNRSISQDEVTDIFEIKFAELIVRECAEIVEGFTIEQEVALDHYQEYEAGSVLKEHFGVEE
jgi:hypothetical protein